MAQDDPLGNPEERSQRFQRFRRLFDAVGSLSDRLNEVIDTESLTWRHKPDEPALLFLVVSAAFGKALKTFQAIERLCVLGYGEDALIILRSNVNLLINTANILSAPDPHDRVRDFLAYALHERRRFLKGTYNIALPWTPPFSDEEIESRAKQWGTIADRAKSTTPFHYFEGYKLYSSFEHSDAFALDNYFTDWNERGPMIHSTESDTNVGLAIGHSYGVMADIFTMVLRFFRIDRPDIERELRETWPTLKPDPEA